MRATLFLLMLFACAHPDATQFTITHEEFSPNETPTSQPIQKTNPTKVTDEDLDQLRALHLLLPVEGVQTEELRDSYSAKRSGGRTHHAIDIMAPKQTPVLATVDGTIVKLHKNKLGGITIYQTDPKGLFLFYYAHLAHYETGLEEGKEVKRGEVLGYVGNTGNAKGKSPHLHFSISKVVDPSKWWKGLSINPYKILTSPASTP